jgi:uncharacterized protein YifN (PemK superfamily)
MAIAEHPGMGIILHCDFSAGFKIPEMVKRRPAVIVSPKIGARAGLCTVVPISTEPPEKVMPYHLELTELQLPPPYDQGPNWIKGDMVVSVGFHRLDLIRTGKDRTGKRSYYFKKLSDQDFKKVRACVLHGLGLSILTKYLQNTSLAGSAALPSGIGV